MPKAGSAHVRSFTKSRQPPSAEGSRRGRCVLLADTVIAPSAAPLPLLCPGGTTASSAGCRYNYQREQPAAQLLSCTTVSSCSPECQLSLRVKKPWVAKVGAENFPERPILSSTHTTDVHKAPGCRQDALATGKAWLVSGKLWSCEDLNYKKIPSFCRTYVPTIHSYDMTAFPPSAFLFAELLMGLTSKSNSSEKPKFIRICHQSSSKLEGVGGKTSWNCKGFCSVNWQTTKTNPRAEGSERLFQRKNNQHTAV